MQVVIDVPEEIYERFGYEYREENLISKHTNDIILDAFCNAIPLPKGHGRLIDANVLKKDDEVTEWLSLNAVRTGKMLKRFSELFIKKIDVAPTIIEADKESEDKE